MSNSNHILPTRSEAPFLVFGFGLLVFPLLSRISSSPVIHEMWKVIANCKIGDCNGISSIATIIGTFFVVATLIITIWSLLASNAKYRTQMNDRDLKHYEQTNLVNDQIKLLVQSNRMRNLREYMIALSINICNQVDENCDDGDNCYGGGGVCTEEDGIIFGWNFIPEEKLMHYRLCVVMKLFSPDSEDKSEILKNDTWWRISIDVIRLIDGSYVVTGYVNDNGSYLPVENEFCDMSEDEYRSVMLVVLSLAYADKERLMKYQKERNWALEQQKQG